MTTATADKQRHKAHLQMLDVSPMYFRRCLTIDAGERGHDTFANVMEPWQKRDFEAMDPMLLWHAGITDTKPNITRFWIQRARGHSKTSDTATSITWLLWAAKHPVVGMAVAEDREQAKLVRDQMWQVGELNPWLRNRLDYQQYQIRNRDTGAFMEIMASDTASSWGKTPHFVLCDEFTHWTKRPFWSSVFSTSAKKQGMLVILCNAGMGRDWKWKVKELAQGNPRWYHSAVEGCQASWINKETLDEQRAGLPEAEFQRLWMNRWQETGGEFVTLEEAERCRDDNLSMRQKTYADGWTYVAAIDYAEKMDRMVGVVCHQEGRNIVVDRMDTVCPVLNRRPNDIFWVMNWARNINEDFGGTTGHVHFVFDKYQLIAIQQLLAEEGLDIEWFEFKGGVGNWELSLCLRQAIMHQIVKWYPGCGQIRRGDQVLAAEGLERDDLETELASLIVQPYANGAKWRIQHMQDGVHHDDRAFALGAAVHYIVTQSGGYEEWGFTPPDKSGRFSL